MGIKISRKNFIIGLLFTILSIVFNITKSTYKKIVSVFYAEKIKNYPGKIRKNGNFSKSNSNLAG